MNFAAINASIAWHSVASKRVASPEVRKLRRSLETPAMSIRVTRSGMLAYTKSSVNRRGIGLGSSDIIRHEISLPYVSILAGEAS